MDKEQKKLMFVKVCCVLLAFSLWLYITGTQNPSVTYTIKKVPVQIKNEEVLSQNKLSLLKDNNYYIDIKVQSKSSEVRAKASDFTVSVDLSGYVLKKGLNKIPIKVEQSPTNVSIVNSGELWLEINLDEIIESTIPVKINVVGDTNNNKFLKQIVPDPKEIKVVGSSKVVESVKIIEGNLEVKKDMDLKSVTVKVKPVNVKGDEVTGVTLETNTVHVMLGINSIKSVPVKVITKGQSSGTFKIGDVSPSTVKIMGDENVINGISYIETEPLDLSNIRETSTKKLSLILPQGIEILDGSQNVDVKVTVGSKSIEKDFTSNIQVLNLNDEYAYEIEKTSFSYKVSGNEDVIKNLEESDFKVYVDLKNIGEGKHNVQIKVDAPSGVSIVKKDSNKVNVTLTKKSQEAH